MSVSALAIFALALIVDAGSPGPTVAALVSRVMTNGFRDVLPFLAALWLGEAVWLTFTVAGLAVVAQTFGALFLLVRYIGVGYLFYLAWTMWHAPAATRVAPTPGSQRPWRMFAAGLLVSIGNPKNVVFYLALLPTIVDLASVGVSGWFELVATMLVTLAAINLSWSCAAVQARRLLANGRAMRIANRIGASLMAGAATLVAAR